jgi:catechol 2,3-dioxygenase-like lactoylglutathione lyase family enzyme
MFGLERLYEDVWGDFPGVVGIGETSVAFFPTDDPVVSLPPGLPIHHLAFRVERVNFVKAQEMLQKKGVEYEFQDHTIVHSLYFYDPDGHLIEVMTYELTDNLSP